VTDCYEPGSTIKPFLLAAALERGIIAPQTVFFCEEGEFTVANHVIHDTKKHGELSAAEIVSLSSNIGAVKIGQELGYESFCEYLTKFGFGAKTGINLLGERKGYIRPGSEARELDKATLFFGQGMSSTSIQLAAAMSVIANGGTLMRPYVVQAITDEHNKPVLRTHPKRIRRVLSPAIADKVAQILEGVVAETGTAPLAAIRGYRVAGKTGTSQKIDPQTRRYSKQDYVAIFVGFVPVSKPRLLILIMVDEPQDPKYGGLVAGPVFRQIGAWGLNHLRVNPQLILAGTPEPATQCALEVVPDDPKPRRFVSVGGVLPDFTGLGMREVLRRGTALGLRVVPEGTGLAVNQQPEPGCALAKITTVRVNFRPPS
jgi:cell division protein FtsI (penicillin-binding protein 3)